MKDFFESSEFGTEIRAGTRKSNARYDGQSVYVAQRSIGDQIQKGDQLYLDGQHKDHLEVFDKNGKFQVVLNLDGTPNKEKTAAALKQGRRLK
ncbi:MAG: hypothetical protein JO174_03665 [Herbaspirillum sp.]|nr:hypothetical protein [Herbaspirillum sp.]